MAQPLPSSGQANGYAAVLVTLTAAITTLTLRLLARRLTRLQLWYDDWLIIVAALWAAAWSALVLWWLQLGLGVPGDVIAQSGHLDPSLGQKSRLILWLLETSYGFSLALAKLAILAFYWRMFKTSVIKVPIQVLSVCAIIWLILRTFLTIFHCVPVQKFWNPMMDGICTIDDSKFFFGTVLAHLLIDLAILILPIIEVNKLHLPMSQKLGIIAMFMFGIFVCVASVVVLVYSKQYNPSAGDMQYNIAPIIIWATVEVNLAIVSACLPMLRPIWFLILRRPLSKGSSADSRYHTGSRFQSQPQSNVHAAGHKLATLKTHASFEKDESESTHHLANGEREGSFSSTEDIDDGAHGNRTIITGLAEGRKSESRERQNERDRVKGGIVVTSETSVRVDRA